ncbi:MAG: SusC/RagA family TonB-linked outer membrane protein [Bacteroidales bacterium]|nr:SusC/RagA family TonB-linked outer membrane protein [Bacteroidales bacterium]
MKNKLLIAFMLTFGIISNTYAQTTISGVVTGADDGQGIPGVNVVVEGTTQGTITNMDGNYSLSVAEDVTALVFTFVGYDAQTVAIDGKAIINVTLSPTLTALNEVVVTAMGISREKKSLAYSTQQLDNEELTTVKHPNVINSLSGKVAGLQINKSASGLGGSTRVVLRGNKSTRNNQPLYVIDGIPILNYSPDQPSSVWGGSNADGSIGRDGGDIISSLNPDDIESISVLKGASAAALYGSQAANGAIMITTKKGIVGSAKITFSSTFTFDEVVGIPEMQYDYGQTTDGAVDSWGAKGVNAPDHVSDFFQNGATFINSISFSAGTEKAQTYISYANTHSKGVMPTSKFDRHNLDIKESANFFDGKLEMTAHINYVHEKGENRPGTGLYFNPLTGLYFFPRGLNFNNYRDNYEVFDPSRNLMSQNWIADNDNQQNPYWILNRNQNYDKKDRVFANLMLKYNISKHLNLVARGNMDKSFSVFDQQLYATTQGTLAESNGRYVRSNTNGTQLYGDLLLNYNKYFGEDFNLTVNAGTSIRDTRVYNEFFDSKGANLRYANIFSLQNINQVDAAFNIYQSLSHRQLQSVFANAQLGYKSMLYFDLTGRNDWSSTLPDKSYFYPSVGLSAIISEMVEVDWMDFGKVRLSYAMVGNDVDPYVVNERYNIHSAVGLQAPKYGILPGTELKPELSKSTELGFDFRFLQNRLNFDLSLYKTSTENQFIQIGAPLGSGYTHYLVNAGVIENQGVEMVLEVVPVRNDNFEYSFSLVYTKNTNTVKELHESLPNGEFYLTEAGVNNYAMLIREGGSFGDIYGKKFLRGSSGRIVVDADGKPLTDGNDLQYVGNPNPDYMLGFNNNFNYRGFNLRFLIDGRFGGQVMSITEAQNDLLGVSKASADARDAGGVDIEAEYEDGTPVNGLLDATTFYTTVGGRAGITEYYTYDATNIRLRELSLGYLVPLKSKTFDNMKVSFVARNLFFFMNKAPFDPDISMSTGTALQGVDTFSLPSTRSFGLSLIFTIK